MSDADVAVIGGGLVGVAVAYGLARRGRRVALVDEGDVAARASRGNFALVWVQAKGLGLPEYAVWTVASSSAWGGFAADLAAESDTDVAFERPGGFHLMLSEAEFEARAALLHRFHNQAGVADYATEMMRPDAVRRFLPDIGPDVVGGSFCPLDGHVNSLRLFRALHTAFQRRGGVFRPGAAVSRIEPRSGGGFRVVAGAATFEAGKVVLAAGNANAVLAPMVGLAAPMAPNRGHIVVTERVRPFLRHPLTTLRQTDEGSVMIGDSKEDGATATDRVDIGIGSMMAQRAIRMFPLLGRLNVVRSWSAVRVMPADGFPIYDQSTRHPGAFLVTCHSGVTLAAAHALLLAPMIDAGALAADRVGAFSARRFDVPKAA